MTSLLRRFALAVGCVGNTSQVRRVYHVRHVHLLRAPITVRQQGDRSTRHMFCKGVMNSKKITIVHMDRILANLASDVVSEMISVVGCFATCKALQQSITY